MTNTKQIRVLNGLPSEHLLFAPVIKYIDVMDGEVREQYTLKDIIEQFKNKQGSVYESYNIGMHFKELVKHIEKDERALVEYKFYQDTYDRMKSEWDAEHPDIPFDKHLHDEMKRKRADAESMLRGFFNTYMKDTYSAVEKYKRILGK